MTSTKPIPTTRDFCVADDDDDDDHDGGGGISNVCSQLP